MLAQSKAFARLLVSVSALAIAVPAVAQTDATPPNAAVQAAQTGQTSQDDLPSDGPIQSATTADIVVTGSRIVRNGNSSPSPVTVVATNDLLATQPGANLADALNILPVFAGSRGAGSNPSTAGSASGGNGSANQLNLRNLGIARTLVLQDGLRIPPTLFNGAVDVDLIPQLLVERVDVVTGGVSAVYGSDAISGVVNYILDKDFTGLRAETSMGVSTYGDARQFDAGAAYGTRLGERAHFEASYQYHDSEGILRRSDRPWMNLVGVGGLGTAAAPFQLFTNLRQSAFPAGGRITCAGTCSINGQYFAADGVLAPFVNGAATGTNGLQVGGAGGTWDSSLLQPLESHQAFGRMSFDASDAFRFYVQGSATIKTNENFQEYPRLTNARISSTNAFLPASVRTALLAANQSSFTFSKTFELAPRLNQVADSEQYTVTTGVAGDLGGGWRYAADYVYGRAILATQVQANPNNQRLSAALDAVVNPATGQIVCNVTLTNPSLYPGCVPLNPFGPTATSTDAINYVLGTTNYRAVTTQHDVSGSVSGSPIDLWAGPLGFAVSAEWRKVSFSADSDATSQDLVTCTGLRFNCVANQAQFFLTLSDQPPVSQTVWEVAGELDAPIFRNSFLGKSLDLNGAVRYTSYNTSGEYVTWKVGFDWALTDTLRLRGTRSRDIRAPTLYDLFAERFIVTVVGTDLLTNQSPTIPSLNGGNPDLTAEIANTITGGAVWRPTPAFSVALDAYRINVENAILSVNGGEAAFQRACYASNGTSPYCDLQTRPGSFTDTSASNAWTSVTNGLFNISSIKTWGVDLEVNYSDELFNRPLSFRFLGAYQPALTFEQPNVATREQAGSAYGPIGFAATPKLRLVGFLRYKPTDEFSIDLLQRWRSSMKLSGEEGLVWVDNKIASFATTSVNLAWDIKSRGNTQVYFNVQNVFDADPPIGGFYGNGTRAGLRDGYAAGDDPRGRFYTAGVRLKF